MSKFERSARAERHWCIMPAALSAVLLLPLGTPRAQPASEQPEALAQRPAGAGPVPASGSWAVRVGAGGALGPNYPGSETIAASPLPLLDVTYRPALMGLDTVFLSTRDGLGVIPLRFGPVAAGASLSFLPGRDQDLAARLNGLGDIDPAAAANVFLRADFGPLGVSARVERGLGQQEGTTLTLGAAYRVRVTPQLMMMAQAGVTWADGEYMQQWFGVDARQAARSRFGRYDAGAGVRNVSAGLNGVYVMGGRWELNAGVGVSQLLGDAADSPITQRATQPFGILGVAYRF